MDNTLQDKNMSADILKNPPGVLKYKIFVINLDRSADRLLQMQRQLENAGLEFERVPAVDGNALDDESIGRHYSKELNRKKYYVPLKKAEIGCYMSHLKACKKIVESGLDYGIILEDDLILKKNFRLLPEIIRHIPADWDYIKLIAPFRKKRITGRIPIEMFENASARPEKFELVRWNKPPTGTQAYAISRSGAEEFLRRRSVFFRPIDVDLQFTWETGIDVVGLEPQLCKISDAESTIGGRKLKPHYPAARLIYKLKYAINSLIR